MVRRRDSTAYSPSAHAVEVLPAVLVVIAGVYAASAANMRAHSPLVQGWQGGDDLGEPEHRLAVVGQPPRCGENLFLDRFFVAGQERSLLPFVPQGHSNTLGREARPGVTVVSGAELSHRCGVGTPLPLSGDAQEAMGLRRPDPLAEEAPGPCPS